MNAAEPTFRAFGAAHDLPYHLLRPPESGERVAARAQAVHAEIDDHVAPLATVGLTSRVCPERTYVGRREGVGNLALGLRAAGGPFPTGKQMHNPQSGLVLRAQLDSSSK